MNKIRYSRIEDSAILAEIHTKSWQIAYKGIIPQEILEAISIERRAAYFEQALTEKTEEDALIFYSNKPVGFICIGQSRDLDMINQTGEIRSIYLLSEYWNKGIGSELLNWGMSELNRKSYSRVTVWVLEDNLNARKFYEKHGFEFDGTIKQIEIGKKLNEIRLCKILE